MEKMNENPNIRRRKRFQTDEESKLKFDETEPSKRSKFKTDKSTGKEIKKSLDGDPEVK